MHISMLEFSWFITVISLVLQHWKMVIFSNIGKFGLHNPTLGHIFPTLDYLIFQQLLSKVQHWTIKISNVGEKFATLVSSTSQHRTTYAQHWVPAHINIGPSKFPTLDSCTIQDWTTEISHVARSVSNTGLMGFRLLGYTTLRYFKFFLQYSSM